MSAVHACGPSGREGSLRQRGAILVTVMLLLLVVSTRRRQTVRTR